MKYVRWITFYRRQQELFAPHAASYADDVKTLEELPARLCKKAV